MYPKSQVHFPFNRVPKVFKNNGFTDDELMKLFTFFVNDTDGNTVEDRKKLLNNKFYIEKLSYAFRYRNAQDKKNNAPNSMDEYAQWFVIYFLEYILKGWVCEDAFDKALEDVKKQRYNNQIHPVFPLGSTIKTANNITRASKPLELRAYSEYLGRQYEVSQEAVKQVDAVASLLALAHKK